MTGAKPLAGLRVLIVEDEFLVAYELETEMEELGAEVVKVAGLLSEALEAADGDIHGALVDIHLRDEDSYPLIDKLSAAGIPLILTTGYDLRTLPEPLRACPRVAKPFAPAQLQQMAQAVFRRP